MRHGAFYSTAAQVIPVIWIVLVFQLQFFGDKPERDGAATVAPEEMHRKAPTRFLFFIIGVAVLLWVAELSCLLSLLEERDDSFGRFLVRLALVAGVSTVFYIPIAPWFEALVERSPAERYRQRWFRKLDERRRPN